MNWKIKKLFYFYFGCSNDTGHTRKWIEKLKNYFTFILVVAMAQGTLENELKN